MIQTFGGLGAVLFLVGHVWLAVLAFKKGVFWGLGVLCIPCVAWVFIVLNWSEVKTPALIYVIGWLLSGSYSGYQYQRTGSLGVGPVITR
jgi:hypothetical protein